jgi:hypothetical protein
MRPRLRRSRLSTQHEKHTNKGTLLTAHRGPVRLHPCQWPCAAAPVSEGGTIDSLDAWGVSKCRLCRVSVLSVLSEVSAVVLSAAVWSEVSAAVWSEVSAAAVWSEVSAAAVWSY